MTSLHLFRQAPSAARKLVRASSRRLLLPSVVGRACPQRAGSASEATDGALGQTRPTCLGGDQNFGQRSDTRPLQSPDNL